MCTTKQPSVKSVSFSCEIENYKELCKISCNLVKGQKVNNSFEVEAYEQPFGLFILKNGLHIINFGRK